MHAAAKGAQVCDGRQEPGRDAKGTQVCDGRQEPGRDACGC